MDYINKNSLRIIKILDEKELYFSEIYEKSKIKSKNNLLKNLNLLVKNNILIKRANKSNTYFSLNYQNQQTLALLDVLNKEKFEKLPFHIKKSVLEIIHSLDSKVIILFGSYAKGNFEKNSDIDIILVDSNKNKKNIKDIENKYGVKINPVFLNLNELKSENKSAQHIFKTGLPLLGKEYFYEEKRKI